MRKFIQLILLIVLTTSLKGQHPWIVKQINKTRIDPNTPSQTSLLGSYPYTDAPDNIYSANGKAIFFANDEAHGTELWASDGTDTGTAIVANLTPGSASSIITNIFYADNLVFFRRKDSTKQNVDYYSIWRTDGTLTGTFKIFSESKNLYVYNATFLNYSLLGGYLYLNLVDNQLHPYIYKIDVNTLSSTIFYATNGDLNSIGKIVSFNNKLYVNTNPYTGSGTNYGMEIYTSDGTSPLQLLCDFSTGNADTKVEDFADVSGNYLVFYATVTRNSVASTKLLRIKPNESCPVIIGNSTSTNFQPSSGWNDKWVVGNKLFFMNSSTIAVTNGEQSGTFNITSPSTNRFNDIIGKVGNKIIVTNNSYQAIWDGLTATSWSLVSDSVNGFINKAVELNNKIIFFNFSSLHKSTNVVVLT